jgi:hypothetical protein
MGLAGSDEEKKRILFLSSRTNEWKLRGSKHKMRYFWLNFIFVRQLTLIKIEYNWKLFARLASL